MRRERQVCLYIIILEFILEEKYSIQVFSTYQWNVTLQRKQKAFENTISNTYLQVSLGSFTVYLYFMWRIMNLLPMLSSATSKQRLV